MPKKLRRGIRPRSYRVGLVCRFAHELEERFVVEWLGEATKSAGFQSGRRTDGSSRPLMKMMRVSGESFRSTACTSSPFMSGIQMSRITNRHDACPILERKSAG